MDDSQRNLMRGALAGAAAAAVWWVQQPLDRRLFGVAYDDTELLGKAVTRGAYWPVAGVALHLANGAGFGAAFAALAPRGPLPRGALAGAAAGLAEHLATWPLTAAADRFHPARAELPTLWGDPRAFAQATWRHLLFGAVLGELERRLNGADAPPAPSYEAIVGSNGHGDLEHAAVASGPARG